MVSIRLTSLAMQVATQLILLLLCNGAVSSEPATLQPAVQQSACDQPDCSFHQQQPSDHDQLRGQLGYATAPWQSATQARAAEADMNVGQQHVNSYRRQLLQPQQTAALPATSHPAMEQWLQDSRRYTQRFTKGSCFSDYPGFIAKDITDLVRLLKDPAATHVELKGDIVFSHDLFPPENANDKSKGINITHKVEIRACTSAEEPVIVDINHALQQIYVYGQMVWQGSIKFINPYPSPRRGGMVELISVLSVEMDGVVEFRGLHIHSNEPSPMFKPDDPYWYVYQNDSKFVPKPYMYTKMDSNAVVIHDWTFNKAAWVLRSQGTQGLVRAEGNGHWRWVDVLDTWSPATSTGVGGLSGPALALAVALPVVFGVLVLACCGGLAWWRRRRRREQAALAATVVEEDKLGQYVQRSAPSKASTGGGQSPSNVTGGGSTECLGREISTNSSMATSKLIEQARRRMQETTSAREGPSIVLEALLGEGTFGKVYSAMWKGTLVAVKTMLLPAAMSGKERREKMAIMETAISSSLSHPNIVQTYTYEVRPLTGELARKALERKTPTDLAGSTGSAFTFLNDTDSTTDNHGWELRLVLEMADLGNLKEFLGRGGFMLADGQRDMAAIVATALDVARAMLHLHTENIIHSDLKARNVLLKSAGGDARGFVAKVSDFGLSMRIDPSETHVSNFYQGTLTHMAPEVLMYGKISFASDVYAYGIILWEMYTAMQAFKGVPRALLGHEVTKMSRRPEFPPDCPFDFQLLACRCWESDPAIRPTFAQILADLERMSSKLLVSRMDSASSLPMHPSAVARRGASSAPGDVVLSAGHLSHPNQPQGFLTSTSAGAAAAAAASGAGATAAGALQGRQFGSPENDIDPARYHNWEPQTSLLELSSTNADINSDKHDGALTQEQQQQQRVNGATGLPAHASAAAATTSSFPSSPASRASTNRHHLGVASLGTWDAPTGGLWLSGSLAPVSQGVAQGGAQGATPLERLSSVQGAANSGQPSAVQLRQLQQQQRQLVELQAVQQQQQPPDLQDTQAALHAVYMQEHQQLTLQQYVLLRQQQYAKQHAQQQQQPRLGVPARLGVTGANASRDASSSGVYVENSSSIGLEGSTGATNCSGGATGSTEVCGGVVKPGSGGTSQEFRRPGGPESGCAV